MTIEMDAEGSLIDVMKPREGCAGFGGLNDYVVRILQIRNVRTENNRPLSRKLMANWHYW